MVASERHTFVDASEEAFAAAVYLRNQHRDGHFTSTLLMSKTKHAPTKTLSELPAVLLGTRLATYVGDSISEPLVKRFFWTDNSCIRNWLRSRLSAYKTFVSHRIGEIKAATAPEEWRHVPGGLNNSDIATRSSLISEDILAMCFSGPAFLLLAAERWSKGLP